MSLWNYYRDEPNSGFDGLGSNRINYSIKNSKSFDYKTSITGKFEGDNVKKDDVKIVVPLKYLSNFWRTLDMALINCEREMLILMLILQWMRLIVKQMQLLKYKTQNCMFQFLLYQLKMTTNL